MRPYCEYPECHDTSTTYYAGSSWLTSASGYLIGQWRGAVFMSTWPMNNGRRLCQIHAQQEFGVSLGGRVLRASVQSN